MHIGRKGSGCWKAGNGLAPLFHRLVTQRTEALQLWLQSVYLGVLRTYNLGPFMAGRHRQEEQQKQQQEQIHL
ncbi:hypothetical protein CSHISOI_07473 [Colletotrichum shisoi]|uniref:Uncharacterized protein n=1 Tax=Colletotrichum shisoi TaxID=2078593 RepID=A0A5Q4BNU7_9PEZI|nr:hypothetical protein CSHISOI_07473 [Colletotrichum shisoi]